MAKSLEDKKKKTGSGGLPPFDIDPLNLNTKMNDNDKVYRDKNISFPETQDNAPIGPIPGTSKPKIVQNVKPDKQKDKSDEGIETDTDSDDDEDDKNEAAKNFIRQAQLDLTRHEWYRNRSPVTGPPDLDEYTRQFVQFKFGGPSKPSE